MSVTSVEITVTVQFSLLVKSESGLSVKVVGPPLTDAELKPLLVQVISNQLPLTTTASLKVISMFASMATLVAALAGVVLTI